MTNQAQTNVHPLIISRMFWPEVAPSSLHLTPKLEAIETEYEAAFHHFKPDKHLRWLQELGTASVTLELEDRTVTVDVTPLQAAVAELFESQDRWAEDALANQLGVEVASVRSALTVWAGHGVLKDEEDGIWRLLERVEDGSENAQGEPLDYISSNIANELQGSWPTRDRHSSISTRRARRRRAGRSGV